MDKGREAICLAMSIAASMSVIGINSLFMNLPVFAQEDEHPLAGSGCETQPAPSATAIL